MNIDKYLNYLKEKEYSEGSINTIRKVLKNIPSPLTEERLNAYQKEISKLKTTTRISYLSKLKHYLLYQNKSKLAKKIEMPRLEKRLPQNIPTEEAVKRVIEGIDTSTYMGIRDRAILELLYSTGMRRGEISSLTVSDIDYVGGIVRVSKGKGKKDRLIPVGQKALYWLDRYIKKVRDVIVEKGESRLFVTERGKEISPNMMYNIIKKYKYNPHKYRHAYATHLLRGGMKETSVSKLLGHEKLTSTQVYTSVTITDLKKSYDKYYRRDRWK